MGRATSPSAPATRPATNPRTSILNQARQHPTVDPQPAAKPTLRAGARRGARRSRHAAVRVQVRLPTAHHVVGGPVPRHRHRPAAGPTVARQALRLPLPRCPPVALRDVGRGPVPRRRGHHV